MEIEVTEPQKLMSIPERLSALASQNKAFNAIAHIWSLRERARSQVTVHTLMTTLKIEGFDYQKSEVVEVLKTLANMKIGRLELNSKGETIALKDVKYTLQSIGLASVSKKPLSPHTPKTVFTKLPIPKKKIDPFLKKEIEPTKTVVVDEVLKTPIKENQLQIKIGYKTYTFDLFQESKVKDLLEFIDLIYANRMKG